MGVVDVVEVALGARAYQVRIGGGLMAVAAVLLVTKKRMNNK